MNAWDQKRIQRTDGAKEMGVRLSDDQVEHLSIKYYTSQPNCRDFTALLAGSAATVLLVFKRAVKDCFLLWHISLIPLWFIWRVDVAVSSILLVMCHFWQSTADTKVWRMSVDFLLIASPVVIVGTDKLFGKSHSSPVSICYNRNVGMKTQKMLEIQVILARDSNSI